MYPRAIWDTIDDCHHRTQLGWKKMSPLSTKDSASPEAAQEGNPPIRRGVESEGLPSLWRTRAVAIMRGGEQRSPTSPFHRWRRKQTTRESPTLAISRVAPMRRGGEVSTDGNKMLTRFKGYTMGPQEGNNGDDTAWSGTHCGRGRGRTAVPGPLAHGPVPPPGARRGGGVPSQRRRPPSISLSCNPRWRCWTSTWARA